MAETTVTASAFAQQMGTQKINAAAIAAQPAGNANLTDLLHANPSVSFSHTAGSANTGGEIRPDEVSFHGEKFYNNNFTIDGVSNNDNLDPGSAAASTAATAPRGFNPFDLPAGGTQSIHLDTSLIQSLQVFDSNVSARYGQFTGGAVNAQLINPDPQRVSGRISWRTTRDKWAQFHRPHNADEDPTALNKQPFFTKHNWSAKLNVPLGERAAMLLAYTRTAADIPFHHSLLRAKGAPLSNTFWDRQRRLSETYLARAAFYPDGGDVWTATLMYSPHASTFVKPNVMNGAYTNTGGGFAANVQWERSVGEQLKMNTQLAWRKTGNEIAHEADATHMYKSTPSIAWARNRTITNSTVEAWGGYGQYSTEKKTLTLKQDFTWDGLRTGAASHQLAFGWAIDRASAAYERPRDVINYRTYTVRTGVVCAGDPACIAGEQYASARDLYRAMHARVNDSVYSAYVEDHIQWGRLSATLGLRADRGDFLGNTDIAPRSSLAWDIWGDQSTRVFGGFNRYYSASMLAYKLRSAGIGNYLNQSRTLTGTALNPWSAGTASSQAASRSSGDVSGLKTPRSDERVLGIAQKIAASQWTLKYVERTGRDQFTRQTRRINGQNVAFLANGGTSRARTLALTIEPSSRIRTHWADIHWQLGASRTQNRTNNSYYDASLVSAHSMSIYRGQLMPSDEVPPEDYSTPWRAFLSVSTHIPTWGLHWGQRLSVVAPVEHRTSRNLACTAANPLCAGYDGEVTLHTVERLNRQVHLDWRLGWKLKSSPHQSLELTLDIHNVLNRRTQITSGSGGGSYKMGRNLWLGVALNY